MCLFKLNYLNYKGSKRLLFSLHGSVCVSAKDGLLHVLLNDLLKKPHLKYAPVIFIFLWKHFSVAIFD